MPLAATASMRLPFSSEQFFEVFARYNQAVWPLPVLFLLAAIGCSVAAFLGIRLGRTIGSVLAFLWGWMGIVYHVIFFTGINPLAWGFGAAFVGTALLFAKHARARSLRFDGARGWEGAAGLVLIVYSILGYPLVATLAGQVYPRIPTFGLPCPTTIFTLGLLLLASRPVPALLFIVPLTWVVIGSSAAVALGVVEDLGLFVAGLVVVGLLARRWFRTRRRQRGAPSDARSTRLSRRSGVPRLPT